MTQSDKCHALTFLGHAFFNWEIFTQKKYKICFKITLCLVLNLFKTEKKVNKLGLSCAKLRASFN